MSFFWLRRWSPWPLWVWHSGNAVVSTFSPVSSGMGDSFQAGKPLSYVTSNPGHSNGHPTYVFHGFTIQDPLTNGLKLCWRDTKAVKKQIIYTIYSWQLSIVDNSIHEYLQQPFKKAHTSQSTIINFNRVHIICRAPTGLVDQPSSYKKITSLLKITHKF